MANKALDDRNGQKVARRLRAAILPLMLRPGPARHEAELAEQMKMSRPRVRLQLLSDGPVRRHPRAAHNRHSWAFYDSALRGRIRLAAACSALTSPVEDLGPTPPEEPAGHLATTERQHRVLYDFARSGLAG